MIEPVIADVSSNESPMILLDIKICNISKLADGLSPVDLINCIKFFQQICYKIVYEFGGQINKCETDHVQSFWLLAQDSYCTNFIEYGSAAFKIIHELKNINLKYVHKKIYSIPVNCILTMGSCGYFIKNNEIVNVIGLPVIRLNRYMKLIGKIENSIVVDDSIKNIFKDYTYSRIEASEEKLYKLHQI